MAFANVGGATGGLIGSRIEGLSEGKEHRQLVGQRLKCAREIAGLQQIDAAREIGYQAATQLNEAERGKRMLHNIKLIQLAKMYGTTMDYLLGLTDDLDTDPDAVRERCLTDYVMGRFSMLAKALTRRNIEAVRKMGVDMAETLRLSQQVLELEVAVARMRRANPGLDEDVRGLATVVLKVQTAAESARAAIERHERAHRAEMHHVKQVVGDLFSALAESERGGSLLVTSCADVLVRRGA